MRLVKRAAITVTPKQPYIGWANNLDENFQPERHIYLIGDVSGNRSQNALARGASAGVGGISISAPSTTC